MASRLGNLHSRITALCYAAILTADRGKEVGAKLTVLRVIYRVYKSK